MSNKVKFGKFKLRKSTPDLSEWGKHDAKLIEAVNKNDVPKINSILTKKGISPTKLDSSGNTVFHRAARDGKAGAVQVFINNKANVNARDGQDRTPLHYACKHGHVDIMKSLIRGGASPLYEDKDRQTPLHQAAGGGRHEAVQLLMRLQDAPVNIPDVFGQTPLHLAAHGGHLSSCEDLMDHGALLDYQDSVGRTPLMLACEKGNTAVADVLANNGANIILNDKKGHNAMWYAVNFGRSDIESLLRDVPHNPAWDMKDKPAARQLYHERSVDSGRGGTLNGHHATSSRSNAMDVGTALVAMSNHSDDSSSDDEEGYMVPINQHPETSRSPQRPKTSQVMDAPLSSQPRSPPPQYDQQAYQSLEEELEKLEAIHQRSLLENKHLKSHIGRLETQLSSEDVNYMMREKDLLEEQIILLTKQLDDERAKTTDLSEKVKLLQFQLESTDPGKLVSTTSERDLRDMAGFEVFQSAHKKEMDGYEEQINELKNTIEHYCKGKDDATNRLIIERASNAQVAEELGQLKDHIEQLRTATTPVSADLDMQELINNRTQIDYELLQVQDILENLKNRPIGGPVDSSPFMEIEHLRKENDDLLTSNNDLQGTVNAVQQQLRSFQELANINDKLMSENTNLKHERDSVMKDLNFARTRQPMIIDGTDELIKYNQELLEQNEHLRDENDKLLSQLKQVQTDIEKTMSKLPSIEEFVATQQDNERMRRELEKIHVTPLTAASTDLQKENEALRQMVARLKEKVEILESDSTDDRRITAAKVHRTTSSASSASSIDSRDDEPQRREMLAMREMIKQLNDRNDQLELELSRRPAEADMSPMSSLTLSTPSSNVHASLERKPGDTENMALKEMVTRLREYIEILESEKQNQTVPTTAPIPNTAEVVALREMVQRLKEQNEILELAQQRPGSAERTRTASTSSSNSSVNASESTPLEKENLALKVMVERLREQNEILESQQPSEAAPASQALTPDISTLQRENFGMKIMLDRLKEQNDILEAENRISKETPTMNIAPVMAAAPTATGLVRKTSSVSSASSGSVHEKGSSGNDVVALKMMVGRLQEQNEILENQLKASETLAPPAEKRRTSSVSSYSSIDSTDGKSPGHKMTPHDIPQLQKQNVALKSMVERLKEKVEIMELENQVKPEDIKLIPTMPTSAGQSQAHPDTSALQRKNFALKMMIERLKEQNNTYELEYQQKPVEIERKRSASVASSTSSTSTDINSDLKKENDALKEMVQQLQQQNQVLEAESRIQPQEVRHVHSANLSASSDVSALQKENFALKLMVDRLKDQGSDIDRDQYKQKTGVTERSASNASSSSSASSVVHVKTTDVGLKRENLALREMVERLKEQRAMSDLDDPRGTESSGNIVPVKTAVVSSAATGGPHENISEIKKENLVLKEMLIRLRDENDIFDAMHFADPGQAPRKLSVSSHSFDSSANSNLAKENTALREMVKSQKEQIEILEARTGGKAKDPETMKVTPTTVVNSSSHQKSAGDVSITKRMVALEQMVQSLKERNEILETQRAHRLSKQMDKAGGYDAEALHNENLSLKEIVKKFKTQIDAQRRLSDGYTSKISEDRQMTVLRAMVASQRERIEILEAENPRQPVRQPTMTDDERRKMRDEIESLEDLLKKASQYNMEGDPDISELRSMMKMLNERNGILEQQVLQVTKVNRQMGEQIAINEELSARNKGLQSMIAQLTLRLAEDTEEEEAPIVREEVSVVPAAPVMAAVPLVRDDDLLGLRREKDALKEMVKSFQEQIHDLEIELDKERERNIKDSIVASPLSADLENDNMRLRAEVARLEGILTLSQGQEDSSKTALGEMVERQKEQIDILELELDQKPKEVLIEIQDSQEADALKEIVQSQREHIDQLQRELDLEPKEAVTIVHDTKKTDALVQIVESQKERIELMEMEGQQDPKEVFIEVTDTKTNDAMKQIIESQKERIESLEVELQQKPKEVLIEVQDTQTVDALKQMVQSQRERIEMIERELDITPKEVVVEVHNRTQADALNIMLQSQKERIDLLESELDQKPKEIRVEVQNTTANEALNNMLQSQKERVELLELELGQQPKEIRVEVPDRRSTDALNQMVHSQKERIEILESQVEQTPKEMYIEVPDVKATAALNHIIQSQQERIEVLENELQELRKEVTVEVEDTKTSDALTQMVQSQKEQIELMEAELDQKPTEVIVEVENTKAREAFEQILDSQRTKIQVIEQELQQKPKELVREVKDTRENDALKQMVQSQRETIELIESELQQKPKEVLVQVEDHKSLEALNQIVQSQSEQIEVLELELDQTPEKTVVEVRDTKRCDALQEMVESQKEQIDIFESRQQEMPTVIEKLIPEDTSEYKKEIAALRAMIESLREQKLALESQHIKEEIIAERLKQEGIIEELTATNKGLESMIFHLTKEVTEQQKEAVKEPKDIEIVQTIPVHSSVSHLSAPHDSQESVALRQMVESQKERINILESDEPDPLISKDAADIDHLAKENLALKKVIDSQKERISLLESEQSVTTPVIITDDTTTTALTEMVSSQKERIEILEQDRTPIVVLKEQPELEKENTALKLMVESLRDEVKAANLAEETPTIVVQAAGTSELHNENLVLKQMVESLREQISIFDATEEAHKVYVPLVSTTPVLSSPSSSFDDERELQHAQTIVKLNQENTALKEIIGSLKEQIERLEHEQKEVSKADDDSDESSSQDSTGGRITDLIERNENLSTINVELQNQLEALEEVAKLAEDMQVEKSKAIEENQDLNEEIFRLRQLATFADDMKREHDNVIDDRSRIQEELDRLKAVLINSNDLEQGKYEWVHEKSQLESEIIGLNGTIGEQSKLLDGSEKHTESLENQNRELALQLIQVQQTIEQNNVKNKERESDLGNKVTALNQLLSTKDNDIQEHEKQLEDIHMALVGTKEELDKKDSEFENLKKLKDTERQTLLEDNEDLKRRVEEKILPLNIRTEHSTAPAVLSEPQPKHIDPNDALKNMVESLKERNDILEAQLQQDYGDSLTNEELQAKSKGLESMVFKLTEELASLSSRKETVDPKLLDENKQLRAEITVSQMNIIDARKELDELRDLVARQKHQMETLEQKQEPVEDLIKFESSAPVQSAAPGHGLAKENEALLKEITALKLIINVLKEEKMALQVAQENANTLSHSSTLSEELHLKNEELQDENERMQENVRRLQEQLNRASAEGDAELIDENESLKDMLTQLKEENGKLEDGLKRLRQVNTEQQRDINNLHVKVAHLQKDNEKLEKQLETRSSSSSSSPPPVPTSPIPPDFDDKLRLENSALKAMVESLKEENEELEGQVGTSPSPPLASFPLIPDSKLQEETHALKLMIESQKEKIMALENEETSRRTPELDALAAENKILAADVHRLENELKHSTSSRSSEHDLKEITALRSMVEGLKEENESLQEGKAEDVESMKEKLEKQIKSLQFEWQGLQDSNELLNGQINRLRKDLETLQTEIDHLRKENERMTFIIKGDVEKEHLLVLKKEVDDIQFQERKIGELKDTVKDTAFEKIQLNGEVDILKEKVDTLQQELEKNDQDAAYLKNENKDLRVILHTIQEANRVPPDHLARKMKQENHKLQSFIEMLESKVDRILSPESAPQNFNSREKLTLENQLSLLQKQLENERKKHKEIVNTYRSHLLAAVQGHVDPDVSQALQHIITLRQPSASGRSSRASITHGDNTAAESNVSSA